MKRRISLCLIVLIMFFTECIPAFAETEIPAAWNLSFETDDVLAASKEACLIFRGLGFWEGAEVQTIGVVVLDQYETDNTIELSLYTARSVFDISSGVPERVAGGIKPVKLIFEKERDGFRLLSYQEPEDGERNAASKEWIFGEELSKDITKRQLEYTELALGDAADDAGEYLTYLQTGEKNSVWLEFLPAGSEESAAQLVLSSVSGGYPSYPGVSAGYRAGKLYTVSVDGEQSYSGVLTFGCYDAEGNSLEAFTVQVVDGKLQVLGGILPELEYE